MQEKELRNNYLFTIIKFILFIIIFCFLIEITREFWRELRAKDNFDVKVLAFSVLFSFAFYVFLVDLNDAYKKIQNFFFRSSFFSLVFPSALILLAFGYMFIPKVFNINYNRDIFIFLGGCAFAVHLIFIAQDSKGHTFTTFINYIFIFSILYIINLLLLGVYFRIGFDRVYVGRIAIDGIRDGAILLQNIFTQALR